MFIRTKDGVYELTGKPNAISITNNVLYYCWDENGENEIIIRDDEIINQFDNLVELCDGLVEPNENFIWWFKWYTNEERKQLDFTDLLKLNHIKLEEVRGFIITDKGLIYVAKLNADGKLVLI